MAESETMITALRKVLPGGVPPPNVCCKTSELPQFFKIFEKYVYSLYGDDRESWLQVLPNFCGGEISTIVEAFDSATSYDLLKERILRDFVDVFKLSGKDYISFINMRLSEGESLKCFLIRLERLVARLDVGDTGRNALLLEVIRMNIPSEVLFHVDLHFCGKSNVCVQSFIDISESIWKLVENKMKQTMPSDLNCEYRPNSDSHSSRKSFHGKPCSNNPHVIENCNDEEIFESNVYMNSICNDGLSQGSDMFDYCGESDEELSINSFDNDTQYSDEIPYCNSCFDSEFSGGYYIVLNIEGEKFTALLDTGAEVSVMSSAVLNSLPDLTNRLVRKRKSYIRGIGGAKVGVDGEIVCNLRMGNNIILEPHRFKVVESCLSVPVILGVDFIRKNNIIIDCANDRLLRQNCDTSVTELPLSFEMIGDSCNAMSLNTEILKPRERKLIHISINGKHDGEGCIVPHTLNSEKHWRMAGSVNVVKNGVVYGEIINLSNGELTIKKGVILGSWQPVCRVVNILSDCSDDEKLCQMLGIEGLDISDTNKKALRAVILSYRDVFSMDDSDLGFCDTMKHVIDTGTSAPIKQKYRRLNPPVKDKVNEELIRMEKQGVIERSISPWCSPLVPVRKKDGRIRICIDFRKLNAVTKFNSYPLPNIEDNLCQFSGARYFSTLDLLSGYHQVALEESSKEKTAFATERGLFQFKVMPQGACGSPATFQNLMNIVLEGISSSRALAYLDDVLVVGTTFGEHLANLEEVFRRLRMHGLKLSVRKCNLFKHEVQYLGHVLTREGVKPAKHNVNALLDLPTPRTVRQVKKINGLVNYYGRFIKNLADIMAPLYRVTSEKKLRWTPECDEALNIVKKELCKYPVLSYPRYGPKDEFILTTDASGDGVGAVLSQVQDGEERPLGYGSSSFNRAQRGYSTTEKELAAVRYGVKHFKPYLYGRKFVIRVDHKALIYLEQMKNVDGRLLRTYEDLQIGDYRIEYIKGLDQKMQGADFLSRCPGASELDDWQHEELLDEEKIGDPEFVPCGGPNSLFEALNWARQEPYANAIELRTAVVEYLLSNLTKYDFCDKSQDRKWVTSFKDPSVFADHRMIQPYVDLFSCRVNVHHNPGPVVMYDGKTTETELSLECLGGIHFNGLIRERDLTVERVKSELEKLGSRGYDLLEDCDIVESSQLVRVVEEVTNNNNGKPKPLRLDGQKKLNELSLPFLCWEEAYRLSVEIHENLGHPGRDITLLECKKRFRTKKMWKLVAQSIENCLICQKYKPYVKSKHQKEPLFSLKSTAPGEVMALDLMDLGGRSKQGNRVLLVAVDMFTKFACGIPLRNKKSMTVARALEQTILANHVCVPKTILSDNGPEFRGTAVRLLLERYDIKHSFSIPYRPESNGVVERLNRTLKMRLATATNGAYDEWDKHIGQVMYRYNRTVHSDTGRTPVSFYLNNQEIQSINKKPYFSQQPGKNFKPYKLGDLVWRKIPYKDPKHKHKLAPIFEGPFRIKEVISDVSYMIQDIKNTRKIVKVHVSQLKPCHTTGERQSQRIFRRSKQPKDIDIGQVPAEQIEPSTEESMKSDPLPLLVYTPAYVDEETLESLRTSAYLNIPHRQIPDTPIDPQRNQRRSVSTPENVDSELPRLSVNSEELNTIDEDCSGRCGMEVNSTHNRVSEANSAQECNVDDDEVVVKSGFISGSLHNDISEAGGAQQNHTRVVPDLLGLESNEVSERYNNRRDFSGFSESQKESGKLFREIQELVSNCTELAHQRRSGPVTRSQTRHCLLGPDNIPGINVNGNVADFEGFQCDDESVQKTKRVIEDIQRTVEECKNIIDKCHRSGQEDLDASNSLSELRQSFSFMSSRVEFISQVSVDPETKLDMLNYSVNVMKSVILSLSKLHSSEDEENIEIEDNCEITNRITNQPFIVPPMTYVDMEYDNSEFEEAVNVLGLTPADCDRMMVKLIRKSLGLEESGSSDSVGNN